MSNVFNEFFLYFMFKLSLIFCDRSIRLLIIYKKMVQLNLVSCQI